MMTRSNATKDDVLYAFSVEQNRDANTLAKYLQDYPQYRDELVKLSIDLLAEPIQENASVDNEFSGGVAKAWEKFQSTLSTDDPVSRSTYIENPLAKLDKKNFRDLAKSLGLSRLFLTRLRDQTIVFSSIPMRFIEKVANAINVSVDTLIAALDRPPEISSAQSFKANGKPTVPEPISFDEAIDTSNLTEEQKATLKVFRD